MKCCDVGLLRKAADGFEQVWYEFLGQTAGFFLDLDVMIVSDQSGG